MSGTCHVSFKSICNWNCSNTSNCGTTFIEARVMTLSMRENIVPRFSALYGRLTFFKYIQFCTRIYIDLTRASTWTLSKHYALVYFESRSLHRKVNDHKCSSVHCSRPSGLQAFCFALHNIDMTVRMEHMPNDGTSISRHAVCCHYIIVRSVTSYVTSSK